MDLVPSASYSFTLRCELLNRPGVLGRLTTAIGEEGGDLGAIDIVSVGKGVMIRDITVAAQDEAHAQRIQDRVSQLPNVQVVATSDRTFLLHLGGKIEVTARVPVKTRDDLSMVYTPGVARVCLAIRDDPDKAWNLTIRRNTVAVVSDGSAVLGLGNIGPLGAMPVMEGKCMLFKEFGGVDAFPLCLATQDTDEIVETVARLAPSFGGINLEDISAPRCFEIERRLQERMDIPVFHDDQHGTAVVVLAALFNALRVVGKRIEDIKVVVLGAGAAGVACTRMLLLAGARNVIVCDRRGAIHAGRTDHMNPEKDWLAEHTNPRGEQGSVAEVLRGADVFIGVSGPDLVQPDAVRAMAADPIVFALSNPNPEVRPEAIRGIARVIATGRSDFPNQINNVLCFPGIFRGALDCLASRITEGMKMAAARAIADVVAPEELNEEYIIPSVFNRSVGERVAAAVRDAAYADGVARRARKPGEEAEAEAR